MKRHLVTLLIATCLCAPAFAEEFYVELGRTGTEVDAKLMWEELETKYKFLRNYDVFPNQILQADGSSTYRVQAGPMSNKREAQRICNRLFRRQVACFVIEGFDPQNQKTFDQGSVPEALIRREDVALPWERTVPATRPSAEASTSEERPDINALGEVRVAEAIAVPVTAEQSQVTIASPVEIAESSEPSVELSPDALPQSGWVVIQPFLDDARARDYWSSIRGDVTPAQRKLSVRVIQPVVSHDVPKLVLVLGEFASEVVAQDFCRAHVPASTYLECQFSSRLPDGEEVAQGKSESASAAATPGDEYSQYWVQILSEPSYDAALEQWERIRTDNDDLLAQVRSQIATSVMDPSQYHVRIGPLKTKRKAGALCDALAARGVACTLGPA